MNRTVVTLCALALALALPAVAQQEPPKPPTQPGQTAPAQPETPPVNKEEEDAYKAFYDSNREDHRGVIRLGEAFLQKFPDSRYTASVYARLINSYLATEAIDKLFVAGEKALEQHPENVDVLPIMAWVIPRRTDQNALDFQQKLDKAEGYGRKAVELLEQMERPETVTEEQFAQARNEKLAMCRSGLGLIQIHRQRFNEAAAELEQATQLAASPDPTDFYLLGLAYQYSQRFKNAATAYDRCASVQWAWQDRCQQNAAAVKRQAAAQP